MDLVEILCMIIIMIGLLMIVVTIIFSHNNSITLVPINKKKSKFCILIPARDESLVIRDLLVSIKKQTRKINFKDVYIIIEDAQDPSTSIAQEFGAHVFVRKRIGFNRKGYALDEVIKEILKEKKHYDAYFVMDADNVMKDTFIEELEHTYHLGYDIGIGYRNCKNGNDNIISSCSSLTFSMLNTLGNSKKNKDKRNVTISGTGFYIKGSKVEQWGSWPFHSLTEDYEMTLYSILNDYTSYYNDSAIFYDEQPVTYKQTVIQRIRWIKGYIEARRKYIKKLKYKLKVTNNKNGSLLSEIVGVKPYIFMVCGAIMLLIYQFINIIKSYLNNSTLEIISVYKILGILILIYLVLMIFTIVMLIFENKKINLSTPIKIKTIFVNPLFLITYLPCAIKALLKKEVIWEKIEHTKTLKY